MNKISFINPLKGRMICTILLLINLTLCVCGMVETKMGPEYQAEEGKSITVEWSFSSETDIAIPSLKIHCLLVKGLKVFYNLDNSVNESQHEQFAGRVRCEINALRTGTLRLHLSRVNTTDSGLYLCRMATAFGRKVKQFSLNITLAVPKPVTPKPATAMPKPAPTSRQRISLCVVLGLAAAAVLAVCCCILHSKIQKGRGGNFSISPCVCV